MARDIDGGRAIVEVDANLDEKSVRKVARELKEQLKAADTSFKADAELSKQSVAKVKRDVKAALDSFKVTIAPQITKKALADLRRDIKQMLAKAFQVEIFVSKANLARVKAEIRQVLREETSIGVQVSKKDLAAIRAAIKAAVPKKVEVKTDIDKFATITGRIFGRGARNNFFNLFGILVEGAIRGVFGFIDAIKSATKAAVEFGQTVLKAFQNGADVFSAFAAGLAKSGTNIPQLISTAAILGVTLTAVSVVAGSLVATLYSLAGAVISVATALTGALVGGAIVATAALAPLVAIVGSLAAAWLLANKNQKDAFKQLIQDAVLSKLKDTILEANDVLIDGLAPSLEKVGDTLATFKPAILGVAKSLNVLGEEIADSLDSKEFRAFRKSINKELPEDTLKLGRIISDTFGGFGGLFVSLQPAVDKYLERLGDATQRFNTFANSAEGQQSLSDFFLQAEEALGSVGRLIKETGALFANMFKGAAGEEGISLLDSLTGKIKDLNEFIKNNPESVASFFEGASEVARNVGDALVYVTREFGKLNTAANRDTAGLLFVGLVASVKTAILPLRILAASLEKVTEFYGAILEARGKLSGNEELAEFGRELRNFGEDVGLSRLEVKYLTTDLSNLKAIGQFKINADTNTIVVANQRSKKLIEQSGVLRDFPGITIEVDKEEVDAATSALELAKKGLIELDGEGATIKITTLFNGLTEDLARLLTFNTDAVGGVMKGGKQIEGGKQVKMASGGIVASPTFFGNVLTGEAGPEAIVPLRRPLSRVDPSVRALSAVAQGKASEPNIVTINQYLMGPQTSIGQVRQADWAYRFSTQVEGR